MRNVNLATFFLILCAGKQLRGKEINDKYFVSGNYLFYDFKRRSILTNFIRFW